MSLTTINIEHADLDKRVSLHKISSKPIIKIVLNGPYFRGFFSREGGGGGLGLGWQCGQELF